MPATSFTAPSRCYCTGAVTNADAASHDAQRVAMAKGIVSNSVDGSLQQYKTQTINLERS